MVHHVARQACPEIAECGTPVADCGMRIIKTMVQVFNPQSGIHNPESTIRMPQSEIRNPKSATSPVFSLKILVLLLVLLPSACSRKAKVVPPAATRPPASAAPMSKTPPTLPTEPAQPITRPEPSIAPQPVAPTVPATSEPPNVLPGPGPLIRIGLTTAASEVRVLSAGEYLMTEKVPETLTESVQGEIRIRIERESGRETEAYRIQVASLSTLEAAQELKRRLSALFSLPVVIRESAPGGLRQVRLGDFGTREEAQKFVAKQLAEAGFRNTLIVRETGPAATSSGELALVLRGSESLFRVSKSGFLFFPKPEGTHLQFDGKPYRGSLDISLNKNGRITVVNQLGIEEYLLGVVPAELSPAHYPDPEALAAQSIAARTYALKNMGRYRAEGYDLTPDIRTQVYGGVAQEKEAATQAVGVTYGLAIYYQNSLIDAMYTSTCGGRTEDFSNVYEGPPVPYLRSVLCSAEANARADPGILLQGKHALAQSFFAEDGAAANRNLELASTFALTRSMLTFSEYHEPAQAKEVREWVDAACRLLGKVTAAAAGARSDISKRAGFLQFAVEQVFGAGEIDLRISQADVKYYLGNIKDGTEVPDTAKSALAYVVQKGLWSPYPDNTFRPHNSIRRGEALSMLVRWIESLHPELLRMGQAVISGSTPPAEGLNGSLSARWNQGSLSFPLARDLHLFRVSEGKSTPVETLNIIGNEKLKFHVADNGQIDFLEVELNPTGAASDRISPVASWKMTIARLEIARKVQSLGGNIGALRDLKPSRLGSSGRVVQLELIGSKGRILVNGYKFRNALGLRDTLFTIARSKNPDGSIESFTFNGRGWGHGVGLCQVGAVGMARAGRRFEEILKTYYQGVELRKAY